MSLLPAVGRNAWERATTVLGAGFLRRVGSLQALKPLSTIGQFPFLRNSVAWVRNASGVFEQQAIDMPLVHFRFGESTPVTMFEPLSVNHIRNPIMAGAAAGTPGTLPNNWAAGFGGDSGLSRQVVATGIENGQNFVDVRYFGTSTGTGLYLYFEVSNHIAAAQNQSWRLSSFLRSTIVSFPSGSFVLGHEERNSSNGYLTESSSTVAIDGTLRRLAVGRTVSNANAAFIRPFVRVILTSSQFYDFTLRICLPQLEQFSYETSVMPSNGSAAFTRAVSQFPVNNLQAGGVFGATTGTIVIDIARMVANAVGTAPWVLRRADGTEVVRFEANGIANQYRVNLPTLGQATDYNAGTKIAVAWDGTNVRIAHGGNIIGTFAGVLGAVDQLRYTGNGLLELRNQLTFATADTNAQLLSYIA